MSIRLGAIADDYTGASDLANTLTKAGLRTVQTIGVPAPDLVLSDVDAVVVALKSRSIPAADAVAQSQAARDWLKRQGARHILFKICSTFDSTDAGNIGQVLDALRGDLGPEAGQWPVLVTPAFPETGRTVYFGNLFVNGVPLNESPLKDHPLNPMTDSSLVRVLARQSQAGVALVDLATVVQGAEAVRARLGALAQAGTGAAIADAVFERDLETLGLVALEAPLSVGASGLGLGLARALVAQGVSGGSDAATGAPVAGAVAAIAGSCSAATLEQIARAEAIMPVLRLDPEQLVTAPDAAIVAALDWARPKLEGTPVLIAASGTPDQVAALQARYGREASGHAIEQASARLAEGLVEAGVRRLIVAGGETSGACVDRLGLAAFAIGREIAAGVPLLRTVDHAPAMLLALKSGNFGGPDFFAAAVAAMQP
ncbi:HPr kinase [Azorhizobium oxalatiphilum]|uniref:3-oxo-tetronate kinase n=1 Tax=Azorhizobium oxalatiphilum TaxID=980631 RepID=A0A917BWS5_9HYPH|nr:3-oxo-tetronate kinase [Azorhizobium oxalatiphilum]GGF61707.1 HPr kinase [Azorhizobium oxalatiphilum]